MQLFMQEFYQGSLLPTHFGVLVMVVFANIQFLPRCEETWSFCLPHELLDKVAHLTHVYRPVGVFINISEPFFKGVHLKSARNFAIAYSDERDEILHKPACFTTVEDPVCIGIVFFPQSLHNPHNISIVLQIREYATH